MNSKQLVLLALAFGCVAMAEGRRHHRSQEGRQLNPEGPINEGVRNNFISILTRIGNATEIAGTNVSRAAALMIRGIVREGFNLGSVATYIPRLLLLDGPNQFIETLRLVRSNQLRLPTDMDTAIDTLITFTGSVRDSGIGGNFAPLVEFFPNIFTGVEKFVQDLLYNTFAFFAPIPPAASLDQQLAQQNVRVVSPSPVAPVTV